MADDEPFQLADAASVDHLFRATSSFTRGCMRRGGQAPIGQFFIRRTSLQVHLKRHSPQI